MKIQELLKFGYDTLKKVNIDTYMLDAQLLLGEVLKVDKLFIITNRDMTVEDKIADEYISLIKLREKKMPVKYIIKRAEFMGIDFFIKEGVLIPRGDTEILVEEALKEIKINSYKNICDVCCGSGAIGVAIAYYEEATNVICYDISDIALEVTKENVNKHKLNHRIEVNKSDLLSDAIKNKEKFDVVVSNPPYIKKDIIDTLMEDVKNYEPFIALCGGEDGLYFYRKLVIQSKEVLNRGGTLLFEIGYDQKEEVMKLMKDSGFIDVICIKDLSSNDRVVRGKLI